MPKPDTRRLKVKHLGKKVEIHNYQFETDSRNLDIAGVITRRHASNFKILPIPFHEEKLKSVLTFSDGVKQPTQRERRIQPRA